MLYDTHCHPYLSKTKSQDEILKNFKQSWDFLNCIWIDITTSQQSIELAKKYDFVYATIWIHPCDIIETVDWKKEFLDIATTLDIFERLYWENSDVIIGIWETGFDFHWLESLAYDMLKTNMSESWYSNLSDQDKDKHLLSIKDQIKSYQEIFFRAHIMFADSKSLPLIIHNRKSKTDILRVLKEQDFKNFIFHCYSEDYTYAQQLIEFAPECKISFSWIVTFNSAKEIQETAKKIPLENILVETDAPYLTPAPHRWKQENEPAFTQYVLDKIIELRDETPEIITKQIFENSISTFNITN